MTLSIKYDMSELLSKPEAVHNQGLSAFITKNASSLNIEQKSGLHLAYILPNHLKCL